MVVGKNASGTFKGTAGSDVIVRPAGINPLTIEGRGGGDRICASKNTIGDTLIYGNGGRDKLRLGLRGELFGGPGGDVLRDGSSSSTLNGGGGPDKLYGGQNNDNLRGGAGNDRLYGGDGTDWLYGNDGDDYLDVGAHGLEARGGPGSDTCVGQNLQVAQSC